jgi:hypothetical protein
MATRPKWGTEQTQAGAVTFAGHATAAERRFRRLCAPPATRGDVVLWRRRLHTCPSQGQGAGNHRLPGRRHPAREPGRNKEDQGLGPVRTDGGPPDEGSGATPRPPSRRHRQASQWASTILLRRLTVGGSGGRRAFRRRPTTSLPSSSLRSSPARVRRGLSRRRTSQLTS